MSVKAIHVRGEMLPPHHYPIYTWGADVTSHISGPIIRRLDDEQSPYSKITSSRGARRCSFKRKEPLSFRHSGEGTARPPRPQSRGDRRPPHHGPTGETRDAPPILRLTQVYPHAHVGPEINNNSPLDPQKIRCRILQSGLEWSRTLTQQAYPTPPPHSGMACAGLPPPFFPFPFLRWTLV